MEYCQYPRDVRLKAAIPITLFNHPHHLKPYIGGLFWTINKGSPLAMSKPTKHLGTSNKLKDINTENQRLGSGREEPNHLHEGIAVKGKDR